MNRLVKKEMVCLASEGTVIAIVRDTIGAGPKRQSQITLAPSKSVSSVFAEICADFHYEVDEIELLIQYSTGEVIILNHHRERTLGEINVIFDQSIRNTIVISGVSKSQKPMTLIVNNDNNDDDLLLGASASPTAGDIPSNLTSDPPPALMSIDFPNISDYRPLQEPWNYVGLVNQAMTCYLNSLLQALYMTPEFRNALYKWEFDGQGEAKSIPFQLQKLFLNLQTSTKPAVETTELTRSFGWDLSEAWQQHDIQELCRVMFDALEKKFENTNQANLINDLYQGKLLDYVKCLECGTEKSREDSLLDIPLPVRPFGRSVAYNSVEEALRGFVQPETLEGNNQYFCEKCNKKCNAHKGLKFTKFPYLLTLHLKRFDFDYTTMNRIKLNDKVVFPEMLNLNSFIPSTEISSENETIEERETIKCDDSSTTDSGSVLDDETSQCNDVPPTVNGGSHIIHEDEDEGIDVGCINNQENKKSDKNEPKGPYLYELFSIMIHAGSASGGHYYAYIKDFEKNQWFCFNDQIVNRITEDDIQKTYGGGPARYYSGQYSSSTNAYMLMYRQVDQQRNYNFMTVDEFPQHIKDLLQQMQEKEESDRLAKEREHDMLKLKVYCWHPIQNMLVDVKLFVFLDSTLVSEVAANAHQRFKLDGIVGLDDCRLVAYDKLHDYIECSFDDDLKFCDINPNCEWLLEVKPPESKFQIYRPGGVIMRTFLLDLEEEELDGPHIFYVNAEDTVYDVKTRLADIFHLNINTMKVVQHMHYKELCFLDDDDAAMKFESRSSQYKLFVSNALEEDPDKTFLNAKLKKVIERFTHVISVDMVLPDTDISRLEALSIPSLDRNHNIEKVDYGSGDRVSSKSALVNSSCELLSDQCNSEDSSLSDSDRTLVGDAPGDCIGLLSSTSISPADQHMASPIDPAEDTYNHDIFDSQPEEMSWDDVSSEPQQVRIVNQYFKAKLMSNTSNLCNEADTTQYLKVQVDKRMPLFKLKKHLEPFVGVPIEYFKIFRLYPHEVEITKLIDTLGTTKDGDRLAIKLGRVLKKNEYVGKVFRLTPENSEVLTYLFEFVIASGQLVGQVKKDILLAAKKQHMLDISFNNCRLRAKSWKNPLKVYLDEQKFGEDIILNNNWEMYLQELGEGEIVKDPNQLCLFVKRWCPSMLMLSPFHEIVLNSPTVMELKSALAQESNIPVDNLEVAFLKGAFPCDINVLDIQDLDWNVKVNFLENYPLQIYQDGSVFLYRDSREPLKVISAEEKKEINNRENTRLGKYSSKNYSPRRETALKIYLDSPIKSEEVCVD